MRRLKDILLRGSGPILTIMTGGGVSAEALKTHRSGLLDFTRAMPSPVGPLPLESLDLGGVGVSGAAGAATYQGGKYFVSAASYPANAPVEDRFDVLPWGGGAAAAGGVGGPQTQQDVTPPGVLASTSPPLPSPSVPTPASLLTAVYDGHGGWQAAEHSRKTLLAAVSRELDMAGGGPTRVDAVTRAFVRAFVHTEATFIDAIRPAYAIGFGEVSHVGCCALAALVTDEYVVVANAGDCRAVLGHVCIGPPPASHGTLKEGEGEVDGHAAAGAALMKEGVGGKAGGGPILCGGGKEGTPQFTLLPEPLWKWRRLLPVGSGLKSGLGPPPTLPNNLTSTSYSSSSNATAHLPPRPFYMAAIPMSLDHNAREPREKARLTLEHPGEGDVVVCKPQAPTACYVKSRLQPTRAIGDAYLKYKDFNVEGGRARGRYIRPPYTPPYISSIPELRVQSLKVGSVGDGNEGASTTGLWGSILATFGLGPSSSSGGGGGSSGRLLPPTTASFLLLACDGVWDVMSNEEACEVIARDISGAAAAAAAARKRAREEGKGEEGGRLAGEQAAAAFLGGTAERLRHMVLERTAWEEGLPTRMILALKAGKGGRRDVHDDITAVVTFVGGLEAVARFAANGEVE